MLRKPTPLRVRDCLDIRAKLTQAGLMVDDVLARRIKEASNAFIRSGRGARVRLRPPSLPDAEVEVTLADSPDQPSGVVVRVL